MLRREGFKDNHKRVCRLYREEGLSLRLKRLRRSKAARLRQPKTLAQRVNQIWSMDFVADNLFDGRKLRQAHCRGLLLTRVAWPFMLDKASRAKTWREC